MGCVENFFHGELKSGSQWTNILDIEMNITATSATTLNFVVPRGVNVLVRSFSAAEKFSLDARFEVHGNLRLEDIVIADQTARTGAALHVFAHGQARAKRCRTHSSATT